MQNGGDGTLIRSMFCCCAVGRRSAKSENFVVLDVASSRNVRFGYTLDDVDDEYNDRCVYVH